MFSNFMKKACSVLSFLTDFVKMHNDAVMRINCEESAHLSPDGVHVRHDVAVTNRLLQPLRRGHQLRPEIQHRLEKSWNVLLRCISSIEGAFV